MSLSFVTDFWTWHLEQSCTQNINIFYVTQNTCYSKHMLHKITQGRYYNRVGLHYRDEADEIGPFHLESICYIKYYLSFPANQVILRGHGSLMV